ncbi:MAG: tyrosine-type recombinase/integrase [Candidatus Omnitrophota bacterium]
MRYAIVNRYAHADLMTLPVCEKPFSIDEFTSLLKDAAEQAHPFDKRHVDYVYGGPQVRLFLLFLEFSKKEGIIPDEILLEEFREAPSHGFKKAEGGIYDESTINTVTDDIRKLLNNYFYDKKLIRRLVLPRKAYWKYRRFHDLTRATQKLIISFEDDGRCLVSKKKFFDDPESKHEVFRIEFERKSKRLSDYNRKCYIDKVLVILGALNRMGIESLKGKDLEDFLVIYRKQGKEDSARTYLAALFSIIGNGIALGLLKENPFNHFVLERSKPKSRKDFIMPDQMNKLLDLESMNWNDSNEVRERCLTVLIYDTGLRASTLASLETNDIKELSDGRYQIAVPGVFLKGDKEDVVLYVLFQQTIPLLRCWIHFARDKFNPKVQRLFVSNNGVAMTRTGIRGIVCRYCKKLGISTTKGRIPSPHTLRHTLATLNIEPFGKSLSPRLMQQRLIHMDLETLERNYVHNNPLGEMEEYKRLLGKGSRNGLLERIGKEDFFAMLDSLQAAKTNSVIDIKQAYERALGYNLQSSKKNDEKCTSEAEALKLLSPLGVEYRSLRSWALQGGFCKIESEGQNKYLYDQSSILDLVKNYMTCDEAFKKFGGSRTNFYYRLKRCRRIEIGRQSFVLKDDFLQFIIGRESRQLRSVSFHNRSGRAKIVQLGLAATKSGTGRKFIV